MRQQTPTKSLIGICYFFKKDLKIGMKYAKINIVYDKKTQLLSKMNILENL